MGNLSTVTAVEAEEQQHEEVNCYLYFINMGNSSSNNSSGGGSHKSSKRNIDKKVELASKTGVLSLCGMVCNILHYITYIILYIIINTYNTTFIVFKT